jgi:hypothetical protein
MAERENELAVSPEVMSQLFLATRKIARILLKDLVRARGGIGPWFDELQQRLVGGVKNTVVSGIPIEQEVHVVGIAVGMVEKIFDDARSEGSG